MTKAAKRRKKENSSATNITENTTPLIARLPFELVAEISLYSKSPADVLSLSRTCKHFHVTLAQNPDAAFIWKHVRTQTTPPIPDPTEFGFSEPQLAKFIYGGGICTECGKRTGNMYSSFSARIRLCGDPLCREKQLKNRVFIPTEHPFTITDDRVSTGGRSFYPYYVRGQLLQAKNEHNKATLLPAALEEYKRRKQKHVDRLEGWMNACLELCKWKWEFAKLRKVITVYNHTHVGAFAIDHGWDKSTVMDTPTIVDLLREGLLDFKRITHNNLEVLRPEIEADLALIRRHRENREIEQSRLQRRREVERLYQGLDHSEFDCFPSLHQFRKLPTIQTFQDSTLDVETTQWRNEFVDTLVKNDIKEWVSKTVQVFSERLGYPQWPQAKTLVHPVHWISSRFLCTRCSKSGPKAIRNKSLTFREAAHHTCTVSEKGNKDQWSPGNFVVDAKATAVITRFATAVGVDVQEETMADSLATSRTIMCLSCSAPIVMDFDTMIQHSHRHDYMEFMILADEELVKFSDHPVTPGITAQFVQTDQQTKERRRIECFACKHCIPNPLVTGNTEDSDEKVLHTKKVSKALNFDGLRSHLKQKHKVEEVADEDFFVLGEYLKVWGYRE